MIFFPLYIAPGTGSMLFSLAIGIVTAGVFALRSLVIKGRFIVAGENAERTEKDKMQYANDSDDRRK